MTIFQITITVLTAGLVIQNLDGQLIFFINVCITILIFFLSRKLFKSAIAHFLSALQHNIKLTIKNRFIFVLITLFIFQHIITVSRIHIASPNVLDTLTYHLPIVIKWYQEKKINLYEPAPIERMNYATKGSKTLSYWILGFTHKLTWIELSQYFGYILLLLSIYGILRSLSVSYYWSIASVVTIGFIPIIIIENYTLQDHVLLTAFHFATIKLIFDTLDNRINTSAGILTTLLSLGLLLGAKYSAPAHTGTIALFSFFFFGKQLITYYKPRYILSLLIGVFIMLFIGGLWYLNNFIHYGSLFGPILPQVEKNNKFFSNLLAFPSRILDNQHTYTPDLVNISGFGIHFFSLGLPLGLISLFVNRHRRLLFLFSSSLALLFMYFALYFTPYNYRLFIFFPVTLLIIAFVYIDKAKNTLLDSIVRIVIITGIFFTMTTTLYGDYFSNPLSVLYDLKKSFAHDRSIVKLDFSSDKFNNDQSFLFIDQYIPKNETIAYITQSQKGYDDNIIAAYYDKNLNRKAVWLGNINETNYFSINNRPTYTLINYLINNNINYLHNNVVFYYRFPKDIDASKTSLVELTKNIYYFKNSSNVSPENFVYKSSESTIINDVSTGKKIVLPINLQNLDVSKTHEISFNIESKDDLYLGIFLNAPQEKTNVYEISNLFLRKNEPKKMSYIINPYELKNYSYIMMLTKNDTSSLSIKDIAISTFSYGETNMNSNFLKELNFVNKEKFGVSQ